MAESKKYITGEIIRFIITGIAATAVDFLTFSLIALAIPDSIGLWKEVICSACGFIVSLVVNYLLSAFWVYQHADKSIDKKSPKVLLLFTLFSLIGLFIGIGIMAGFGALDERFIHSDFVNWLKFITDKSFEFSMKAFWFAIFFYGVKTLVVLTWNYLSRKFFIFKSK